MTERNRIDATLSGKTLQEANPALFRETLDAIAAGDFSPAGALLDADEAQLIAANLRTARLRGACACGQIDCSTYYFDVPQAAPDAGCFRVRFYARGEHMLHVDGDGNVYAVERLYDFSDEPRTIYARRPDGSWERRPL